MANEIEKVNTIAIGNIEKLNTITEANIAKYNTFEMTSVNAWQGDRGVFGGGYTGSAYVNVMDYVSIASLNNAQDFGDLSNTMW